MHFPSVIVIRLPLSKVLRNRHYRLIMKLSQVEFRAAMAPVLTDLEREQCNEPIAALMTSVTASGCEINVRCEPPGNSVIRECARFAIAISEVGVMIWSPLLMKYHDGIVFQAVR
jgi:hypothetical protein